jgi:chromosomal replication initiation ATPase DnaA
VLGERSFADKWAKLLKGDAREQPDLQRLKPRVSFDEVVKVVERIRGELWSEFRERHGDKGRDLVLHLAQQRTGLTLRELGSACGDLSMATVSEGIRRFKRDLQNFPKTRAELRKVEKELMNIEA